MPDSKRRTSSSRHRQHTSIRNDGIYIIGDTEIVVKNSGYVGYDTAPTHGPPRSGRLSTALFFLCHPVRCLAQLQHHMQEDGTMHMCQGGTGMIDSGWVRSEGRRHGRLEKSSCPSKHQTEVERADAVDNSSQRARHRRHGRHPSRHSHDSSSTEGISSHRDEVSAKHSSNGASNEFNVSPPRATKTLMLLPKYPPIVDHVLFQPMVQENPGLQEQSRVDFLDSRQRPEASHHRLQCSASGVNAEARHPQTPSDQSSRSDEEFFDASSKQPDDFAPALNPEFSRKSSAIKEETTRH
ncbi:hypothetical protein IG631_04770 [Alternaria alternata]|nr:hypothetical protein IG631_04770 [Alternaria alternata]